MVDINKEVKMCILKDYYGNLLTDRQKEIFSKFWEEDWSLFEIAEELNISRQAVHDSLIKTEKLLTDMEEKCGFVKRDENLKNNVQTLMSKIDGMTQSEIKENLKNIINNLQGE